MCLPYFPSALSKDVFMLLNLRGAVCMWAYQPSAVPEIHVTVVQEKSTGFLTSCIEPLKLSC